MPNGVICGGAVDGSNQLGEMVTCQAMTARPNGAGPAAIEAAAPKISTATNNGPVNARRWHQPLSEFISYPSPPDLQHAPGAQLPHFSLAHSEPAKDFGIVPSELWGDGADPYILADPDRSADVRN